MEYRHIYALIVAVFLVALVAGVVMTVVKKARHRRRMRGEYWRHGSGEAS